MIRFHCLECGMLIQANDSAVGRAAKCPGCGAVLEIPQASFPAPPPPPKPVPAAPPVAVPPVAPPPAPEMAARSGGDALSLEELLGSGTVAAPPVSKAAVGSMPDTDFLSAARVGGKTGAAGKKTGSKTSAAAKPGKAVKPRKATAHDGAMPTRKIRNFSIAAIAAGALGLALFAVPYAGLAVGAIGAAVGLYSVSLASARRNSPMALALAGAALGVVAAGFGGYWTFRGSSSATVAANTQDAAHEANSDATAARRASESSIAVDFNQLAGGAVKAAVADAVTDARNPLNFAAAAVRAAVVDPSKAADRVAAADGTRGIVRAAGPVTLRLQGPGAAAVAEVNSPPGTDATPAGNSATAAKAPIVWAAADQGEAQGTDDVRVTVTKVQKGIMYYHFGDNLLLDERETVAPLLHIWLKVQNNQAAGTIDYKGWSTLPDSAATLTDDKGTEIKRFDLSKITPPGQHISVVNSHPTASIDVSQSNEDVIIFLVPPPGASYLRLTVSGKPAGLPDDLHFQIPISMIKAGETANPLLPIGNP